MAPKVVSVGAVLTEAGAYDKKTAWSVGRVVRDAWMAEHGGEEPEFRRVPKTGAGHGTHFKAVYPASWRARILLAAGVIDPTTTAQARLATWHPPLTGYDPRTDDADCDHCPMRRWRGPQWAPVPPTWAKGKPRACAIGEAPGGEEVKQRAPFVGESGKELNDAMRKASPKIHRKQWDVDNVIACRSLLNRDGKDAYDLISKKLKQEKARGQSPAHEQLPAVHCRPRLLKTLARNRNLVVMGGTAANAVLGGNHSISSIRGGPTHATIELPNGESRRFKVLPTWHPAFVRRARRWRRTLKRDLERAVRFFGNRLRWRDPKMVFGPTPAELEVFLAQPSYAWTYDLETDAREPLRARVRCIAIGRDATDAERAQGYEDVVVVLPFRSCEEHKLNEVIQPARAMAYWQILKRVFRDGRLWAGHNAGWYDKLVCEERFGIAPEPLVDTIMLHRLAASELPHSLGVVGSIYTDVVAWKMDNEGNKLSTDARDDIELWRYCALDVAVTRRSLFQIAAEVRVPIVKGRKGRAPPQDRPCPARPSITLPQIDHRIQRFCAGLTRTGVFIDVEAQAKMERDLGEEVAQRRESVVFRSGRRSFNPASYPQVRDVLYSRRGFGLEPVAWTEGGDPSSNDSALREHLMDGRTPEEADRFIRELRTFRSNFKLLTSFVRLLKPRKVGGVVDEDGRLRVSWSAHVPVTGRVSSSQPMNLQNWPKALRKLVCAMPGHRLVGADFDQLEGRIAAAVWGLEAYLRAFADLSIDPHQITMEFALGERIWKAKGAPPPEHRYRKKWNGGEISGKFNELRNLIKRYFYLKLYGGGDETVWTMLREIEEDILDADGVVVGSVFVYKDMRLAEVEGMSRRFLAKCPELEAGWAAAVQRYKDFGCNWEVLGGRRRDFLDGFDPNEVTNFDVQPAAAFLMNSCTIDVEDAGFTSEYAGHGTGPIQQGHDALVLEVPLADVPRAMETLERCGTQSYPHIWTPHPVHGAMVFPFAPEEGHRWSEV